MNFAECVTISAGGKLQKSPNLDRSTASFLYKINHTPSTRFYVITKKDEFGARSGWFELGSKNPIPDQQILFSFSYAGDAKVPLGDPCQLVHI